MVVLGVALPRGFSGELLHFAKLDSANFDFCGGFSALSSAPVAEIVRSFDGGGLGGGRSGGSTLRIRELLAL
jgi:hypothetical protein